MVFFQTLKNTIFSKNNVPDSEDNDCLIFPIKWWKDIVYLKTTLLGSEVKPFQTPSPHIHFWNNLK